jgi:protein DEK
LAAVALNPSHESRLQKQKKAVARKNAKSTPQKKNSNSKGRPKRAAPPASKKKRKPASSEEEDDEPEDDEPSEDDDEPLKKPPKKAAAGGDKDGSPSDDDIKKLLKDILAEANLEEITMKTVCKKVYAHYPNHDLSARKDFIKQTVKSVSCRQPQSNPPADLLALSSSSSPHNS